MPRVEFAKTRNLAVRIYWMALRRMGWIASQGLAMTAQVLEWLLFNRPLAADPE
jgi:hypothetical protein